MNGILVVDKPKGYTSRDIVNIISRQLGTKKVGHTGTLDPLATGVLVLCIGNYTKFVSYLTEHDKDYVVTLKFGFETDTLDITGNVINETSVIPDLKTLKQVLEQFKGILKQEVPIYSAKKVNGKKLYEYARAGESVKLPVSDIEIYDLELLHFEKGIATIFCSVSKGTYIRSLVRDIAYACNSLGVMMDLRRERVGNFSLKDACEMANFEKSKYNLLTFRNILKYDTYELNEKEYYLVSHGNALSHSFQDDFVLLTYKEKEVALYFLKNHQYCPFLQFDKMD